MAGLPVRYEMLGYDTLLGSHYDKYVMEYYTYEPVPPDPTVFDIPEGTAMILQLLLNEV